MEDMPVFVKVLLGVVLMVSLFILSVPITDSYGLTHHFQPNWGWCCRGKSQWCRPATVCTKTNGGTQSATCLQWENTTVCQDICATWVERKGSNGEECR